MEAIESPSFTYTIEGALGARGKHGGVLLSHNADGERVTIKCLTNFGNNQLDIINKLLPLRHENATQILESFVAKDGCLYVVQRYVEGTDLKTIYGNKELYRKVDERKYIEAGCAVLRALTAIHALGVVHRDIKPSNIVIPHEAGADPTQADFSKAVLIDFDASRMVKPQASAGTRIMGTTGYAAPEQFGLKQTDGRADIYSLGVLLNVMVTGQHPSRRLAEGSLGRIVRRCTTVDPEGRYGDVLTLKEALGV